MKTTNRAWTWPGPAGGRVCVGSLLWALPLAGWAVTWTCHPPPGWTNQSANTALRWSWYGTVEGAVTYAVYFGTNPVPGAAEYLGSTTNRTWPLPLLAPATTYYWQIVSDNPALGASPVWQFTTRGLHHFQWELPGRTQYVGRPFTVRIRAVDEFGQTVSNCNGSVRVSGFTNYVRILFREDFEDGDARGWQVCPDEFTVAVTNVPGCGGQFCLAIRGDAVECDEEGVEHPFSPRLDALPAQIAFRVRSRSTDVDGATLCVNFAGPTVRFGMGPGGLMGLDSHGKWILRYDLAPPVSYEPNRWYGITLAFRSEPVEEGYWDDGWYFPVRYTLLWMDWYVDSRLIASNIDVGVCRGDGCAPSPPERVTLQTVDSTEAWFDDIEFRAPAVPMPVRVQPLGLVQLTNGVWTGQVLVEEPAQELYLQADDGQRHLGTSDPLTVLAGMPFAIVRVARTNDQLHLQWQGGSGRYQVQQTSNVVQGPWVNLGPPTTNTSLTVPLDRAARARFFRVQSLPEGP